MLRSVLIATVLPSRSAALSMPESAGATTALTASSGVSFSADQLVITRTSRPWSRAVRSETGLLEEKSSSCDITAGSSAAPPWPVSICSSMSRSAKKPSSMPAYSAAVGTIGSMPTVTVRVPSPPSLPTVVATTTGERSHQEQSEGRCGEDSLHRGPPGIVRCVTALNQIVQNVNDYFCVAC